MYSDTWIVGTAVATVMVDGSNSVAMVDGRTTAPRPALKSRLPGSPASAKSLNSVYRLFTPNITETSLPPSGAPIRHTHSILVHFSQSHPILPFLVICSYLGSVKMYPRSANTIFVPRVADQFDVLTALGQEQRAQRGRIRPEYVRCVFSSHLPIFSSFNLPIFLVLLVFASSRLLIFPSFSSSFPNIALC
jgi:hypothetical protein